MLNDASVYPDVHLGFIGKMHFSKDAVVVPYGLEFDIIDKASESALGRLGDWDKRVVMVNNHNNYPIPGSGSSADGSHYFYRYRDDYVETDSGTVPSPGSGQATNGNSGTDIDPANLWSTTRFINEAVLFMNSIPAGKRAFLYLPLTLAHSPFDSAPYDLITTAEYKDMGASPNSEASEDPSLNLITIWKRQLGMMEALDSEIARLRSEMDADVLAATTFIIISDNGIDPTFVGHALSPPHSVNPTKNFGTNWNTLYTANENRFKSSAYHCGIASQVIMEGAGVKNGGRTSAVHCDISVDLYPTIAEYFGIDPETLVTDGRSLFQLMSDQTSDSQHPRNYSFSYVWSPNGTLSDIDTDVLAWNSTTTYGAGAIVAWNHFHWESDAGGNLNNEPGVTGWSKLAVSVHRDLMVRMTFTGLTTPTTVSDAERNGTFTMHKFLGGTDGQLGKGILRELYHVVNPDGTLDDFQELNPLTATAGDPTTYIAQLQALEAAMNKIITAATPGAQEV